MLDLSKHKVLHLTLKKKWFDLILEGKKKVEYREDKLYWENRLFDIGVIQYDYIKFVNGYGADKPYMIVEYIKLSFAEFEPPENGEVVSPGDFALVLGDIIETGNLK